MRKTLFPKGVLKKKGSDILNTAITGPQQSRSFSLSFRQARKLTNTRSTIFLSVDVRQSDYVVQTIRLILRFSSSLLLFWSVFKIVLWSNRILYGGEARDLRLVSCILN